MGKSASTNANPARPAERRGVLLFLAKFVGLMLVAYALTTTAWFQQVVFLTYLKWNAAAGAMVLQLFDSAISRNDLTISSPYFAMQVQRGCDASEPTLLFIAAVLAFPAPWWHRAVGLVVGVGAIVVINIGRIISLFLIGAHAPSMFEVAHVEVWQTVFVLMTMLLWSTWAWWIGRRTVKDHHAVT